MLASRVVRAVRAVVACAVVLAGCPVGVFAATGDAGPSASEILSKAEAQARAEHKAILVDFSASWCGNCRLFERFLADPRMHPIMERAFVFVTLITGERAGDAKHVNTPGGVEFEASIGGKGAGFPWLAMLDADGRPIVNSDRPDAKARGGASNIGYPDAPEEVDWFVQMLRKAAPRMSPQDLVSVHDWLTAHSTMQQH